jgi:hypothetical protein
MIRTGPPHFSHFSISMENTRLSRCAQVIEEGYKETDSIDEMAADREHFEQRGNSAALYAIDEYYVCERSIFVPGCYESQFKWFFVAAFLVSTYLVFALIHWAYKNAFSNEEESAK